MQGRDILSERGRQWTREVKTREGGVLRGTEKQGEDPIYDVWVCVCDVGGDTGQRNEIWARERDMWRQRERRNGGGDGIREGRTE